MTTPCMGKARLPIVVLGFAVASGSAGADPAGDALKKFGLIGTWAHDCNEPASRSNPYMIFTAPRSGTPTRQLRTGDAALDDITRIEGAHAVTNERLEVSWTQRGIKLRMVLVMVGKRVRTVESRSSDGHSYIRAGKLTSNNADTMWFSHCGERDVVASEQNPH
jgi:hypothetical protein